MYSYVPDFDYKLQKSTLFACIGGWLEKKKRGQIDKKVGHNQ